MSKSYAINPQTYIVPQQTVPNPRYGYVTRLPQEQYDNFQYSGQNPIEIQNIESEQANKEKKRKKRIKSIVLTLGTVVGLAVLGNKSSNFMAEKGLQVDKWLANKQWYQSFENKLHLGKQKVTDFFMKNKNDTIKKTSEDIVETFKTKHAEPKLQLARGYGRGFVSIFSMTPNDILKTSLTKIEKNSPGEAINSLKKLVGENKAETFYNKLFDHTIDNREFCKDLTDAIADNFKLKDSTGKINNDKLLKFFKDMQKGNANGVDFTEFTKVKMNEGGIAGSWWPVNIIDSIGMKTAKLFGKEWKGFSRGNLGDSLVKFNVVNGSMANTSMGKLVQNSITVPTESISNFVNDKSGMGALLCIGMYSLYNNAQDAPKGKKASTVANDFANSIGSIAISTPLAFGTTYALASLGNLKGETGIAKVLKKIGSVFNLGLVKKGANGAIIQESKTFGTKIKNLSGHALRFYLIMFGFSKIFAKPVHKIIEKIFGKPYDKEEELKKQAEQQQRLYNQYGIEDAGRDAYDKVKHNQKAFRTAKMVRVR